MPTTLRDELNQAVAGRVESAFQGVSLGELLALVIKGLTPTESGATITSHVCTLAANAKSVFQVKGIAGTAGIKKLLVGPITGPNAVVPATGEVVFDGTSKLLFNTADANTTCDVTYSLADATDKASVLLRTMGEQP